jgi:hypothetical protein
MIISQNQSQSQSHIVTGGQSVSKSWCWVPSGPLWREDGSVFRICCWPLPVQSFPGLSPLGLETIFYCLRFETTLFVASYDSQGHGGGIWPRLHTWMNELSSYINSVRTEYASKSPCLTFPLLFRFSAFIHFHGTCLLNRCPAMDYSEAIRCRGNTSLTNRWLKMYFLCGSTIPAFRRHVTIFSLV